MCKGRDSARRLSRSHGARETRHSRRRDTVWLIPHATPGPVTVSQTHQTAGALALDPQIAAPDAVSSARRCALIVERDPALAQALARALQASFEPAWSVRSVSDTRLLASSQQHDAPEIIVLDASWVSDRCAESHLSLHALPNLLGAQMIYVTSDTSYQLSQRGATSGVILRGWRHLDEIVALVAEVVMSDEACV
jgi:hypothetical protein